MIPYRKKENFVSRRVARIASRLGGFFAASSVVAALLAVATISAPISRADGEITLREGWAVESSAKVSAGGEAVSTASFDASSWYKTSSPNTVFAVLVENGFAQVPFFATQLPPAP